MVQKLKYEAEIQTHDCWLRSANATHVLCSPSPLEITIISHLQCFSYKN